MKTRWLMAGVAVLVLAAGCKEKVAPTPAAEAPQTGGPLASEPAAPVATAPALDGEASLQLNASAVAGATMQVGWTGPANGGDYIDIVPRGNTKTSDEISYVYVPADKKSPLDLRAPTTAGDYDVRYIVELRGERKIKATAALTVTAAAATLTFPANAGGGEPLQVAWTGPDGKGDYVDIVGKDHTATSGEITYAYTSAGSPAKISAPGKAGVYLVRYVAEGPGGRKVLVEQPLAVAAATATLKAPDMASKGAKVKVEWTGPKRAGDYIDLVRKGDTATSGELSYFYVTASASEVTAPVQGGEYDIRYVMEAPGGRQVLAREAISVR